MATVTDPIILDSTGQDIVTALGNLNTPRDTAAYTTSFASSDTDDASATSWTVVSPIAGGETHATLFGKLSQIAKNVRFLYKTLGNTDLSAIADGTVTGAISYLNTELEGKQDALVVRKAYSPSGSLAITTGTWTAIGNITSVAKGTYIVLIHAMNGDNTHKIQYMRLTKYNSLDSIIINQPYGNMLMGTFTLDSTQTLTGYMYTSTNLTLAPNSIGWLFIKIA